MCGCNCCNNVTPIVINGIGTVTPGATGSITLLTQLTTSPQVGDIYVTRFILDLSDSALTGAEAVKLDVDGTEYEITLRNGTFLQVGRLRRRQLVYMIFEYDTTGGHFRVLNAVGGGLLLRVPETAATTSTTGEEG